jgi:hypothetical protein
MANVDLTTKKISGCVPGTKKYYHEEGHLEFENKSSIGNLIRVIQDLSFKSLVFLMAFQLMRPCSFFMVLIIFSILNNILSELYEEEWCWRYARHKLKQEGGTRDDTKATEELQQV